MTEKKSTEYEFRYHQPMTYPDLHHPERPGVLNAEPGEVVDFGEVSPPDDGRWYNVASGELHAPSPPPSVETATSAQEDAEDPEE